MLEQTHAVTDLYIFRLLNLDASLSNLKNLTATYGLDIFDLYAKQTEKSLDEVEDLLAEH